MKLSRIVPERTETVTFRWIKRDFLPYNETYRKARKRMGGSMQSCWWCRRHFEDGEMIALAAREKGGNVVLCQSCCPEEAR